MMLVVGIDPGLSGALAFYNTLDGALQTFDMPVHLLTRGGKAKREIDVHSLATLLRADKVGHCFLEKVSSMPGQGSSSVFAFGKSVGIIIGILGTIGIPMTEVAPVTWKKRLQVPAAKAGARARASWLFPEAADQWSLVKHDGRAEAALIALWGVRHFHDFGKAA
jgi:hypothetical protein